MYNIEQYLIKRAVVLFPLKDYLSDSSVRWAGRRWVKTRLNMIANYN